MKRHLTIRPERSPHLLERQKRWRVHIDGEPWGEPFYFNMRGYRGLLPLPDGGVLDPGEITLTRLRAEIARLNREGRK